MISRRSLFGLALMPLAPAQAIATIKPYDVVQVSEHRIALSAKSYSMWRSEFDSWFRQISPNVDYTLMSHWSLRKWVDFFEEGLTPSRTNWAMIKELGSVSVWSMSASRLANRTIRKTE